jgi:hypothetical protein
MPACPELSRCLWLTVCATCSACIGTLSGRWQYAMACAGCPRFRVVGLALLLRENYSHCPARRRDDYLPAVVLKQRLLRRAARQRCALPLCPGLVKKLPPAAAVSKRPQRALPRTPGGRLATALDFFTASAISSRRAWVYPDCPFCRSPLPCWLFPTASTCPTLKSS